MSESRTQPENSSSSTFMVEVMFRDNAGLQGEVSWLEGGKTRSFRSLLELISLIQEALVSADSPPNGNVLRTWRLEEGQESNTRERERFV